MLSELVLIEMRSCGSIHPLDTPFCVALSSYILLHFPSPLPFPRQLRYANNSNYKKDSMIRKNTYVSKAVMEEVKKIVLDSDIIKEDDAKWPEPDRGGRQELEIVVGEDHISFSTSQIGSLLQVG